MTGNPYQKRGSKGLLPGGAWGEANPWNPSFGLEWPTWKAIALPLSYSRETYVHFSPFFDERQGGIGFFLHMQN